MGDVQAQAKEALIRQLSRRDSRRRRALRAVVILTGALALNVLCAAVAVLGDHALSR